MMLSSSQQTEDNVEKQRKLSWVIAFVITLALCLSLASAVILNRSRVERLTMEQLILEKSVKISSALTGLLYRAQTLSAIILHDGGVIRDFEQLAAVIVNDPAILNILAAPNGVVTDVYPRAGNEAVIGLDFFSEGAGNREAVIAKETGELVMGGPFEAVQGGQVIVGRLPVFTEEPDGTSSFWGLVSVTLKYPQALDGAGLEELLIQGFAYEIWRTNPDDNTRQIISSSGHTYDGNINYVERQLQVANAQWFFRILPVREWYEFPETWAFIFIGICISILVAAVTRNNLELKTMKSALIKLSNTDSLTGIHNRRYFMDTAAVQMSRAKRIGGEAYVITLDLDRFKQINDLYGHQAGDYALMEVSSRISKTLRAYDLFARVGGEEFQLLLSDIDRESVYKLAERLRKLINEKVIKVNGEDLKVTISLGIAPAAPAYDLSAAIGLSDEALYRAKAEGRDRSVFYDGTLFQTIS